MNFAEYTLFFDMHSGGGAKIEEYEYILIQAPLDTAISLFEDKFGRNPYNVTCDCCGSDYSVIEGEAVPYYFEGKDIDMLIKDKKLLVLNTKTIHWYLCGKKAVEVLALEEQ